MTRLLLLAAALLAAPLASAQQCNITSTGGVNLSDTRPSPGQTITVSHSFISDGNGPCPEVTVGHFFSDDAFFTDDDVLLGTVTLPPSEPNTNLPAAAEVTIPVGTPRGGYTILAVADYLDEIDESNNVMRGGDLTIGGDANGPNLVIVGADLEDDTAAPGDRVSVEYGVQNQGQTDVGDNVVGFVLVERNTGGLPPAEIFLESEVIGNVEAGETEDDQEEVTIPTSVPPGDYAFVVVADYGNAIEEFDENDNDLTAGILTVTGVVSSENSASDAELVLSANPNPSSRALTLSFKLDAPSAVRASVVDALGRTVATVVDVRLGAGTHATSVDASAWAPGVYVVRLSAGDAVATRTVTIAR